MSTQHETIGQTGLSQEEAVNRLLNEIDRTPAVEEVFDTFEFDGLVEGISAYGKRLRSSKPDNEDKLTQYVWRQAKFNASANDSIPVMADSWLKTYIEKHTSLGRVSLRSDEGKEIKDALELVMMAATIELGHDPTRMAKRMDGVIF
jgi:hypothetical protein